MNRPYGKVLKGATIPYGTLVGASQELRDAYYTYGYPKDTALPPLPEVEPPRTEYDIHEVSERIDAKRLVEYLREACDNSVGGAHRFRVLYMRTVLDMTLEEIGEIFGVSRERIRQIEGRAIRYCRRELHRLDKNLIPRD